jgi:hypothetical protein
MYNSFSNFLLLSNQKKQNIYKLLSIHNDSVFNKDDIYTLVFKGLKQLKRRKWVCKQNSIWPTLSDSLIIQMTDQLIDLTICFKFIQ